MTRPLDNGSRWAVVGAAVSVLVGAGQFMDHRPALALVNESPSLPRGLYLRKVAAEPVRGAVVAVPQPVVARPYLRRLGMPDAVLLIKRIAAVGGDDVCAADGRVTTPGRIVAVRSHDRTDAVLPTWRGCRRLAADELFLLGDTPSSFDSRYFGPVRRSDVVGVYREAMTW